MAAPYPQVVLLGDSLIQGACQTNEGFSFQSALETHCVRRYDVVNRGFSGYNTSQTLKILDKIILPPSESGPKIKYLLVLLGANDAAIPMQVASQHVDLDEYKVNLAKIITHPNVTAHKAQVLLVTPPPLDEIFKAKLDIEAGFPQSTRETKISAQYSEAARQVAKEVEGVVLVDLWKELMDVAIAKTPGFDASTGTLGDPETGKRGYLEQLLKDGLHMTGEAYEIFYKAVEKHIEPQHPNLSQEGWIYPDWREAEWLKN